MVDHPKLRRKGLSSQKLKLWRPWESQYRQKCPYGNCQKLFTRKDNLFRHIRGKHHEGRQPKPCCSFCHKPLSRPDAVLRHESTCPERRSAGSGSTGSVSERSASSSPLELLPHLDQQLEEAEDLSPSRGFSVIVVAPHHYFGRASSVSTSTATSTSEMDVDSSEDSLSSI